jgi:hypothetical protein
VYRHPDVGRQLASERQRDMLAQAERHRLARRFAAVARASRRAERRLRLAVRRAVRLRAGLEQ